MLTIKPFSARFLVFLIPLMILLLSLLSACSMPGSSPSQAAQSQTENYVGPLANSSAWIGLVVDRQQGKVLAYVCDGKTVGDWFFGTLQSSGTFDLSSTAGTHLHGTVTQSQVQGAFTPNGSQSLTYTAAPATDEEGIYRLDQTVDGIHYIWGWVVGANGFVVGKGQELPSDGSPNGGSSNGDSSGGSCFIIKGTNTCSTGNSARDPQLVPGEDEARLPNGKRAPAPRQSHAVAPSTTAPH